MNLYVSRFGDDTCVEEFIPRVGQSRKTPMDAVCIGGRVSLLFGCQHFALTDGVDRGMCIFPVLGECGDVYEVDGHFHGVCHIVCNNEESAVGAYSQFGHVQNWSGLLSTLYAIWIVPILAPITVCTLISSTRHLSKWKSSMLLNFNFKDTTMIGVLESF